MPASRCRLSPQVQLWIDVVVRKWTTIATAFTSVIACANDSNSQALDKPELFAVTFDEISSVPTYVVWATNQPHQLQADAGHLFQAWQVYQTRNDEDLHSEEVGFIGISPDIKNTKTKFFRFRSSVPARFGRFSIAKEGASPEFLVRVEATGACLSNCSSDFLISSANGHFHIIPIP